MLQKGNCKCGKINENISGKKMCKCDNCRFRENRDLHAAVQIFFKFLKQHSGNLRVIGKITNTGV